MQPLPIQNYFFWAPCPRVHSYAFIHCECKIAVRHHHLYLVARDCLSCLPSPSSPEITLFVLGAKAMSHKFELAWTDLCHCHCQWFSLIHSTSKIALPRGWPSHTLCGFSGARGGRGWLEKLPIMYSRLNVLSFLFARIKLEMPCQARWFRDLDKIYQLCVCKCANTRLPVARTVPI